MVGETFAVGVKNELDEGNGSFFCTYKRIDYRLIKAPTFKAALLLGEHDINGHQHYVARLDSISRSMYSIAKSYRGEH